MEIELYILKYCGLFDFDKRQRALLLKSCFFERRKSDADTAAYLHDQYYPFFRPFLSNENDDTDQFTILTGSLNLPRRNYRCRVKKDSDNWINFSVSGVELFLFPEAPGIVSLDIRLSEENRTDELLSALVNATRSYANKIYDTDREGLPMTMLQLIEQDVLNIVAGEPGAFNLHNKEGIANYRGSKLKVFQAIDLSGGASVNIQRTLFALGTVSPLDTMSEDGRLNGHSDQYYEETAKHALNVYTNWTALCLFDTFTAVGRDYLTKGQTLKTWQENYFRIYVYNLYFKYRLFSINGEGIHVKKRLKKLRADFYEFIGRYDNEHISYNFLPNLIHHSIRQGLQTATETEALRSRIEHINGIISEGTNKMTNWILFGLAIIGLLPSNWHDLTQAGSEDGKPVISFYTPNCIILAVKVTIIVGIFVGHLVVTGRLRRFFKRSAGI